MSSAEKIVTRYQQEQLKRHIPHAINDLVTMLDSAVTNVVPVLEAFELRIAIGTIRRVVRVAEKKLAEKGEPDEN